MRVSRETIQDALTDLSLTALTIDKLCQHWELVCEWNQRTNLTAIKSTEEAAWLHYRDSLEALHLLPPGPIVDLGSGAGFPGIPIAAAEPDRTVLLVEPRKKRESFLRVVSARLGLTNVKILPMRAQESPPMLVSAAVTRATFSESTDLEACMSWLVPEGILIAFRSDPGELKANNVHWYEIREDRRCLLIWHNRKHA